MNRLHLTILLATLGLVPIAATSVALAQSNSPAGADSASATSATVTVAVRMSEYRFRLSRSTFKPGTTVVFKVRNAGREPHDFKINKVNKKTPVFRSGTKTLRVTFKKKGVYPYLCTVGRHAAEGMAGSIRVR
jgi:plastocyanin